MSVDIEQINTDEFLAKTLHYTFKLYRKESHTGISYYIGDAPQYCLELYIPIPEKIDKRLEDIMYTAILHKIESLIYCSLKDISEDYMEKYSMGTEIFDVVNTLLQTRYPYIKYVSLDDKSQIPCNREHGDQLDLLTYSIAVNGYTWYEMKLNAYFLPNNMYEIYREQIKTYIHKDTKATIDFESLHDYILRSGNTFAIDFFKNYIDILRNLYTNCTSFPDFFKCLGKLVHRRDKCKLFKVWLAKFIANKIPTITRAWQYDMNKLQMKPARVGGQRYKQTYKYRTR